jgi:hypothetical protein
MEHPQKDTEVREAPTVTTWPSCYGESWTGLMSSAAFSHP